MDLEYQIVVQFPIPASIESAEDVLPIEMDLSDAIGSSAEIDGHEVSSTNANVFVLACDPRTTFESVRERLAKSYPDLDYVAASRKCCDNDDWTLLWPKDAPAKFSL
ncbi:MAG: hypothetical protein IAI48_06590 [Candidatus Eremiobacteraeota bacterium]|nr:hypothetical protein [Candidatus Eremiobacteraeota bacterium]